MPMNLFSTMSTLPTPFFEPISLRYSNSSRGSSLTVPSFRFTTFVGIPSLKWICSSVSSLGASLGETVLLKTDSSGV